MKYSPNITKEIIAELEKVPIIRHVCSKVGIDHSTFYRWMVKHPTFLKKVLAALYLGRKKVNDTAESVIMAGIQNNEFKAAAFWLTHNEERFMSLEKGKYNQMLSKRLVDVLDMDKMPEDYPTTFEKIFEIHRKFEDEYPAKLIRDLMTPVVQLLCHEDKHLIDIYYASYIEWRNNENDLNEKVEEWGLDLDKIDS